MKMDSFSYFFCVVYIVEMIYRNHKICFFPNSRAHHQASEAQAVHPDGTGVTCHCVRHGVSHLLECTCTIQCLSLKMHIQLSSIGLLFTFLLCYV